MSDLGILMKNGSLSTEIGSPASPKRAFDWISGAFKDPRIESEFGLNIWPERRRHGIAMCSVYFATMAYFAAGNAWQRYDGTVESLAAGSQFVLGLAGVVMLGVALSCFIANRSGRILDAALFLPTITSSVFLINAGADAAVSWSFVPGLVIASMFGFGAVLPQRPKFAVASICVFFLVYWLIAIQFGKQFQSMPAILVSCNAFGCLALLRSNAMTRRRSFVQHRRLEDLSDSLYGNLQNLQLKNTAVERAAAENAELADQLALARMAAEDNALLVDVVLDTISNGVIAFGPDLRVIKCNRTYADLMGIPHELTQPGTPMEDIFDEALANGHFEDLTEKAAAMAATKRLATTPDFEPIVTERHRPSGACYELKIKPLSGGGAVATLTDITDRKIAEASMLHKALHDPLTNLANRELFRDRLSAAIARSNRTGHYTALAMIDLDRFKPVNDQYGHPVGDAVLKEVADLLSQSVRKVDTVARLGGDEFAIIFDGIAALEDVSIPLDRVLNRLLDPISLDDESITIGVSMGVAFCPFDADDADSLEKAADDALLSAKQAGKNRYHFVRGIRLVEEALAASGF